MNHRLLIALTLTAALAAAGEHVWLRRSLAVASCAASAMDLYSTWRGSQVGLREGNPLFASHGKPNMLGLSVFKAASCSAPLVAPELIRGRSDSGWIAGAAAQAGIYTFTTIHNFGQIGRAK